MKTCVKNLNFDSKSFRAIKEQVNEILKDDDTYPKKFRLNNFFKKPSRELDRLLRKHLSPFEEFKNLTWHFEIFYAVEPAGLHNDRNLFNNKTERCDRGLIIPVECVGEHNTSFFDLFFEEKVNWDGKNFKTLKKEKLNHDPRLLEKPEKLFWKPGEIIFFDSRQVHKAGEFNAKLNSYKLSINGLGYSKHDPNKDL